MQNEPITIFGDGEQTGDFIFVQDIVAANAFFAMRSSATNDLTRMICRLAGSRSKFRHVPERPGNVKHSMAAIDKPRAAGFNRGGDFNQGLQPTIEFFVNHRV